MVPPTNRPSAGVEPHDPLIGRVLDGRYRILSLIAKGGMGRIYRAEQTPLKRHVALKVLSVPPSADASSLETFQQRFFREASICSKLAHPNTVRIYDYGNTDDGVFFIAMEFLEGRTLRQTLATEAPMAPWRVIDLTRQICASLAEAHSMGLIHRDLKPSNLILTTHADGAEFVNVVDFGLVKDLEGSFGEAEETQAGIIVGSPMYMSPEQILQGDLTERTDIYSLGVIMYGALTGRRPFRQESAVAIMNCHLNVPPPPFSEANPGIEVPANLEWITMTCMEKDPARRFASVQELSRALSAVDKELRGTVPPFQLQLHEGRLVLPVELEDALARRGGHSGSVSSSSLALVQPQVVDATGGEGRRGLWLVLLALGVGLALVGVIWWAQTRDGRAPSAQQRGADDPGAVELTENPGPGPDGAGAPEQGAASDAKPAAEPAATQPGDTKPAAKPADAKPADAKPAAAQPAVAKPADAKPADAKPADAKPADAKPADAKPADAKPAEPQATPDEAPPAEAPPVEAPPPKDEGWAKPQSDIKNPWED